jgi:digeranylgeranylglycerophospholipid reductase
MSDDLDVLVVGGGPIGCYTAAQIAKRGHSVLVVEEHAEIGRPIQCGGCITPRVFDLPEADFRGQRGVVMNELKGANAISPNGTTLSFKAKDTRAYVVNRSFFDKAFARLALKHGAEIKMATRAEAAKPVEGGVEVTLKHGDEPPTTRRAKLLIGADGVQSQVARWFDLSHPEKLVPSIELHCAGLKLDPESVELFAGEKIAPGFFGWIIPYTDDSGLVGLGIDGKRGVALDYLNDLLHADWFVKRYGRAQEIEYVLSAIPFGLLKRTYTDHVMIVGDAAAQVKQTTGGGLYMGLASAVHCAAVASGALDSGDFTKAALKAYQDAWMDDIGKELKRAQVLHRMMVAMKDRQIDLALDILNDPALKGLIVKHGDIDFPSKLARVALRKSPQLLRLAGPAIRGLL